MDIARRLGISQGTVSKILRRNNIFGTFPPRPHQGHPQVSNEGDDRDLNGIIRGNRLKFANRVQGEVDSASLKACKPEIGHQANF